MPTTDCSHMTDAGHKCTRRASHRLRAGRFVLLHYCWQHAMRVSGLLWSPRHIIEPI